MTPEEMITPRYKVVADYPGSDFKIGTIIEFDRKGIFFTEMMEEEPQPEWESKFIERKDGGRSMYSIRMFETHPHLFKSLEWWEDRSVDDLLSVKFVKVESYVGYWRVGDIVPVTSYKISDQGKFIGYVLNSIQAPHTVSPASQHSYEQWKQKEKSRN